MTRTPMMASDPEVDGLGEREAAAAQRQARRHAARRRRSADDDFEESHPAVDRFMRGGFGMLDHPDVADFLGDD